MKTDISLFTVIYLFNFFFFDNDYFSIMYFPFLVPPLHSIWHFLHDYYPTLTSDTFFNIQNNRSSPYIIHFFFSTSNESTVANLYSSGGGPFGGAVWANKRACCPRFRSSDQTNGPDAAVNTFTDIK